MAGISAEKWPRVYPRQMGDLEQNDESHSSGRYTPAINKNSTPVMAEKGDGFGAPQPNYTAETQLFSTKIRVDQ